VGPRSFTFTCYLFIFASVSWLLLLSLLMLLPCVCMVQINWVRYVNSMLSVTKYQVNASVLVLVLQPDFMRNVSNLVHETQRKPTGNR